jgi:hypothetical protein
MKEKKALSNSNPKLECTINNLIASRYILKKSLISCSHKYLKIKQNFILKLAELQWKLNSNFKKRGGKAEK